MPNLGAFYVGGFPLPGHESLPIDPRHPAATGVIAFDLGFDGDTVVAADIRPGWLHRGAEKLFEVRDYRALIMLGDRHDWFSSTTGELVITLAVERALGLMPPARAIWLRALLAELARIHSHLAYLSVVTNTWPGVERMRKAFVAISGNRVHPMLCRVGGLSADATSAWLADVIAAQEVVGRLARAALAALEGTERFRGLAALDAAACRQYGVTGPAARAAGLDIDARRTGLLAEMFEPVPVGQAGDAHDRLKLLAEEVLASATMVRRLATDLPDGPVSTPLSRRLKVPEGEHVAEVEAPWGIASVLLVSRGGQTPWRLALRTPTFHNVAALERALVGTRRARLTDAITSLGYAVGDLDK